MSLIEVEALAKTLRTREREAVKPINFSLEPGELLAFIGPNGAGKSTTIKMLTGIVQIVSWTQYEENRWQAG